jgi:hypothetical protein
MLQRWGVLFPKYTSAACSCDPPADVMRSVRNLLDHLCGVDGGPPYQFPDGRFLCAPGTRLSNDAVTG